MLTFDNAVVLPLSIVLPMLLSWAVGFLCVFAVGGILCKASAWLEQKGSNQHE